METYVEEILADIEWRIAELATIKSLPIKYAFRDDHKDLYVKYSVPALYAIWEGFVKSAFKIYSNHLNSLSISRKDMSLSLLTHRLDSECDFNSPRLNYESKKSMVELIDRILEDNITIKPSVPTKSNVNFKVLNTILERFCITPVDENYDAGLNKLLMFRNIISHGENSLTVNMTHVTEFIGLIENLMLDVVVNIDDSEKKETYKKSINQ